MDTVNTLKFFARPADIFHVGRLAGFATPQAQMFPRLGSTIDEALQRQVFLLKLDWLVWGSRPLGQTVRARRQNRENECCEE